MTVGVGDFVRFKDIPLGAIYSLNRMDGLHRKKTYEGCILVKMDTGDPWKIGDVWGPDEHELDESVYLILELDPALVVE